MTAFDITPLQIPIGGPMPPELAPMKMPIMCKYPTREREREMRMFFIFDLATIQSIQLSVKLSTFRIGFCKWNSNCNCQFENTCSHCCTTYDIYLQYAPLICSASYILQICYWKFSITDLLTLFADPVMQLMPGQEPNVGMFIEEHKKRADGDPNAPPFDDLRNYAYEGGGSTAGSLSSLASGGYRVFNTIINWLAFSVLTTTRFCTQ